MFDVASVIHLRHMKMTLKFKHVAKLTTQNLLDVLLALGLVTVVPLRSEQY
jgi:hypothetical protein